MKSLLTRLLGLERTVVEGAGVDADGSLVVQVRPTARERDRCPVCGKRRPRYDVDR